MQFRHAFSITSGATPTSGNKDYWNGDILWITPEDLSDRYSYWLADTRRKITLAGYESSGVTTAPVCSIALSKRAPIGHLALLERPACSNQGCVLLTPKSGADSRFFYYWLSSQVQHLKALGNGSTFIELRIDDLKSIRVPVPPIAQQCAIADHLDRETMRLDALLAAKQRLSELLAEKRRVLITRAVTRGLNPSAPLRDSAISWVDGIPAHWEVWKIGHLALVGNGSTPSRNNDSYWADEGIPWLNSGAVNRPEITSADQFVTKLATRRCHLPIVRSGAVLIAITGQGKTRGRASVLSMDATINQHLAFIQPRGCRLRPWFLKWVLLAAYDFLRSISDDGGGTKGALTCEQIANLRVPVPPSNEQEKIINDVTTAVAKIDSLQSVVDRTISIIKKRRVAVISDAVTGQIDLGSVT